MEVLCEMKKDYETPESVSLSGLLLDYLIMVFLLSASGWKVGMKSIQKIFHICNDVTVRISGEV